MALPTVPEIAGLSGTDKMLAQFSPYSSFERAAGVLVQKAPWCDSRRVRVESITAIPVDAGGRLEKPTSLSAGDKLPGVILGR